MKSLIRDEGETVRESDGIPGIDWKTGMPLTNPVWAGGPYILVNDYVPTDPTDDFVPTDDGATYGCTDPSAASQTADPTPASAQDPAVEEVPDTIVIDGVTYTRTA